MFIGGRMVTLEQGTVVALVSAVIVGSAIMQNLRERVNAHEEWLRRNDEEHKAILTQNAADHAEIKKQLNFLVESIIDGKIVARPKDD